MKTKSFWGALLIVFLLCVGIFIASTRSHLADPETQTETCNLDFSPSTYTTNEYDALKMQQWYARTVLNKPSSTQAEIKQAREILAIDPVKHFYDLQAKGEEELAALGYPAYQIQAILAFDGSEEAIYRACASLSTHLLILNHDKYPDDTRTLEAKCIFSWNGMPSIRQTDLIALSSDRFFYAEGTGSSTIYYAADVGTERLIVHPDVKKITSGNGRAAGINLSMQEVSGRTGYHPVCGSITVKFSSRDFRQTCIQGTYVHAILPTDVDPAATLPLNLVGTSRQLDVWGKFTDIRLDALVAHVI